MKVYKEVNSAYDFDFWCGGEATAKYLTNDEIEQVFSILDDLYPEGLSETKINDIFWFDDDVIAEWLGYESFEEIMKRED